MSNEMPTLNEKIILRNAPVTRHYIPPEGVFIPLNRRKYRIKNSTGFTNAKQASMLEKGWRLADYYDLHIGNKPYKIINKEVLIEYYDGPSVIAKLLTILNDNDTKIFEFQDPTTGNIWQVTADDIKKDYTAIYFKNSKNSPKNKTRKQKGGFYPSVFGGVRNATLLMPLIMRQCYRMLESNKKTRKSKAKKH